MSSIGTEQTGIEEKPPIPSSDGLVKIDDRDKQTPDNWIPRHREMIRLTGRHPFNAEPPAAKLIDSGLITPNSFHYVRNHGSVPKLDWKTHRVSISGLVDKPIQISMDEIAKFPALSVAVTLACDGNRRKEVNTIKRTRGFNWGMGATGTAVWKGARLRDVLLHVGVKDSATHICFEGSEKLTHGAYGTSIPLSRVLDETNDVLLAYEMNGEKLPPDHGFPVRVIIPGMVGGRMVKWLANIIITDKESNNYYHSHDNKVLPPSIDFDEADTRGWWDKNEFVLYEQNINSAIVVPGHDEALEVTDTSAEYSIRGYAYTGGGRKIIRVDLSFDGGKTWENCELAYLDNHIRYNYKSWVWCHWTLKVPVWKLFHASEMVVRAVDSSFNSQPNDISWNALGMMNNSWYKVKITLDSLKPFTIIFVHPVVAGSSFSGWRRNYEHEHLIMNKTVANKLRKTYPLHEIATHNTQDDCWVVINGEVYDLTPYLQDHPGGPASILVYAGQDASKAFHDIHAHDAYERKERYIIGTQLTRTIAPQVPRKSSESALRSDKWAICTLIEKTKVSPDTFLFKFNMNGKIWLPTGQHILLGASIEKHFIVRPYTPVFPVSEDQSTDTFHCVIKIYPKGLFTQYLNKLKIGDTVKVKGPEGHVFYEGKGLFTIHGTQLSLKRISLVAGGTGITPVLQVIKAILNDPEDSTSIRLLYANHTEQDTLLKGEMDKLASAHPNFEVWYTVSTPPSTWQFSVGRVTTHMLIEHLYAPDPETAVFICGPPAMVEHALIPGLHEVGYFDENLIEF